MKKSTKLIVSLAALIACSPLSSFSAPPSPLVSNLYENKYVSILWQASRSITNPGAFDATVTLQNLTSEVLPTGTVVNIGLLDTNLETYITSVTDTPVYPITVGVRNSYTILDFFVPITNPYTTFSYTYTSYAASPTPPQGISAGLNTFLAPEGQ